MNVFDRTKFDYSFDTSRFGDNLNLSAESLKTIVSTPIYIDIDGWQFNELESNNDIVLSDYYKNPTTFLTSSMNVKLHSISNMIAGVNFTEATSAYTPFNTSVNNCLNEIVLFKAHTDALSCVTVPNDFNTPTYGNILTVGKQVLIITNKTDGIANTLPVLGNFTSLYINPELTANNAQLDNYIITITNSTSAGNSNLSISSTQTIINYVQSITTQLNTRRIADTNFFMNSSRIVDEYNFLTRFSNLGPTQEYLIKNLVGTEYLKSKLASANTA